MCSDPMLERLILRCAVEDVVSTSLHALSSVQKQNTNVQLCGIWPNLTNHVNVIAVNEKCVLYMLVVENHGE